MEEAGEAGVDGGSGVGETEDAGVDEGSDAEEAGGVGLDGGSGEDGAGPGSAQAAVSRSATRKRDRRDTIAAPPSMAFRGPVRADGPGWT